MNLKCLIVDDEPLAQQVLVKYIEQCSFTEVIGVCGSALEAFGIIHDKKPDIVFLDINMPKMSGINFLKSLKNPPATIFTTAYSEFAVEGFELDVIDYLLKPFSFERFMKAVNKSVELLNSKQSTFSPIKSVVEKDEMLVFRSEKRLYNLPVNEICHIEAMGDYVKVFSSTKHFIIHERLKNILEQLPKDLFIQIHRSYIIAINKFEFLEGTYVRINKMDLPIGKSFKENLLNRIQQNMNNDVIPG